MSFVVSARKYRPQSFDEVLGQSHVTDTLKSAILADKLAHAFLFTGPRGVGKTTCARILAKVINSPDPKKAITDQEFGEVDIDVSLNIFELDAASNNSVEHVRNLIEQVRFQPQQGKYKVFIIDEVHMLSQSAFNAFLKTLEEPPPYAIFILATTEKHKILPTILSRCQIFDFKRIQVNAVIQQLEKIAVEENITIDDDSKYVIAEMADGAMRDALSIFDRIASSSDGNIVYDELVRKLNLLDQDYYFKMTEALLVQDKSTVLILFHEILMNGFEGDHFVMGLADHFRDLLLCQDQKSISILEASDNIKDRFLKQSQLSSTSFLMTALHLCNDCDVNYPKAKNKRLHVEIALLKICFIHQMIKHNPKLATANIEKKTLDPSELRANEGLPSQTSTEIRPAKPIHINPNPTNTNTPDTNTPDANTPDANSPNPKAPIAIPTASSTPTLNANADIINTEPKVQETSTNTAKVNLTQVPTTPSASLQDTPNISNIDSLLKVLKKDRDLDLQTVTKKITIEDVQQVWQTYKEKTTIPSTRGVLEKSILSLENNGLIITVASVIGKEIIQQEIGLMQEIRSSLRSNDLDITIQVDKAQFPEVEVNLPKKYLSFKEKYDLMSEKNPELENLISKLDLKKDNNA